jgi:hypothetical protein
MKMQLKLIIISMIAVLMITSVSAVDECDCCACNTSTSEPIGEKEVGDTVKLNVDGELREFIIVQQGSPTGLYNGFENGTVLLMKDILENRVWNTLNSGFYANSSIHAWLNNEFLNMLDPDIRSQVSQVKIPHRAGGGTTPTVSSGDNGLQCRVFLLSAIEVGAGTLGGLAFDGIAFSYFDGINHNSSTSQRVSSFSDGTSTAWWLRTSSVAIMGEIRCVTNNGSLNHAPVANVINPFTGTTRGVRPAFVLSNTLLIDKDGEICNCVCNCTPTPTPTEPTDNATDTVSDSAFTPELATMLEDFILIASSVLLLGLVILVFKVLYWLFRIFF